MTPREEAAHYLDIGIAYFRENRFSEAIAIFDRVLELAPDDPHARWNRATALLSLGDYEQGFAEQDSAWRLFHGRGFGPVKRDIDRINPLPLWKGERGVRLLVYNEWGYGDAIMAMRYLPEIMRRAEMTLVVDRPLKNLVWNFGVDDIVDKIPPDVCGYDYRLSLFGVMAALREVEIPNRPYIEADWGRICGRIGIAWSGRTQTMFSPERFLSLLPHTDYELYALQPGSAVDGIEPLPSDCDFLDVADRIAEMEHVVSVDTAAIHLAGAMGHPSAHLVLPYLSDWRWWHTDRWYPFLKTYRQDNVLDWSAPFNRLGVAIGACRKE